MFPRLAGLAPALTTDMKPIDHQVRSRYCPGSRKCPSHGLAGGIDLQVFFSVHSVSLDCKKVVLLFTSFTAGCPPLLVAEARVADNSMIRS